MNKTFRTTLKTTLIAVSTAGMMTVGLAAASAHVEATPDTTAAGSSALLTFSVPHGCSGSPTTKMTINLPTEINDAEPTVNPNWTITKVSQKLSTPQKLDNGSEVTERTSQIVYTAKAPLDPHQRDTFVLSLNLPKAAGKTIYFPTLQTCVKGQTNWVDIPKAGADEDSVKSPAPSVAITATADVSGATVEGSASAAPASAVTSQDQGGGGQAPGWIGLVAGVLGLGMGGVALARSGGRRKDASKA